MKERIYGISVAIITGMVGVMFVATAAESVLYSNMSETTSEVTDTGLNLLNYTPNAYSPEQRAGQTGDSSETRNVGSNENRDVSRESDTTKNTLLPARLIIPSIKVDAEIEHVGISSKGNMAVPYSYSNVGWYRYGTLPGDIGSSVIAGHVDNGISLAAVFSKLDKLEIGDSIFVEDVSGKINEFIVKEKVSYHYENAPLRKIFARGDKARLNLITCDGKWIDEKSTYDRRLVVFTELKTKS